MKITKRQLRKLIREQIEMLDEKDEKSQLTKDQMSSAVKLDPATNQELLNAIRKIIASELGSKLGDYVSKGYVHRNAVRKNQKAIANKIAPDAVMI